LQVQLSGGTNFGGKGEPQRRWRRCTREHALRAGAIQGATDSRRRRPCQKHADGRGGKPATAGSTYDIKSGEQVPFDANWPTSPPTQLR